MVLLLRPLLRGLILSPSAIISSVQDTSHQERGLVFHSFALSHGHIVIFRAISYRCTPLRQDQITIVCLPSFVALNELSCMASTEITIISPQKTLFLAVVLANLADFSDRRATETLLKLYRSSDVQRTNTIRHGKNFIHLYCRDCDALMIQRLGLPRPLALRRVRNLSHDEFEEAVFGRRRNLLQAC